MGRVLIIAGTSLAIAAALPADIDAQLVIATGCGIDELEPLLSAGPDRVAAALMPILAEPEGDDEPMGRLDLARLIAADPDAIGAIRDAYAELLQADAIAAPDDPVPRRRHSRAVNPNSEETAS